VTEMTKHDTARRRRSRNQILGRGEFNKMLDVLLEFDRSVVELSMGLYNLPRRDRVVMRAQNRRLHNALRKRLPQLLQPSSRLFELSDSS
jgi:hypothetical protein